MLMKQGTPSSAGKKRHPILKVLLIIVIVIAAAIGALCAWVPLADMALRAKYVPDFHADIRAFDGEVRREELPERVAAMDTDPDVTINKLFVNDIPLYECYKDDGTKKPLIIVMHNAGGTKEDYVGEAAWYASMGYYALSIDQDGSGENEKSGSILEMGSNVWKVYDIDTLIEYYDGVEQADATDFSLTGASQGGLVCYYYGEYGKYRPYALMPVGGSVHRDTILHPERFLDINILCGMGAEDERCDSVRDFEAKLKALGGSKGVFRYYEGLGHEDILPEYYEERNAFLMEHLSDIRGNLEHKPQILRLN